MGRKRMGKRQLRSVGEDEMGGAKAGGVLESRANTAFTVILPRAILASRLFNSHINAK